MAARHQKQTPHAWERSTLDVVLSAVSSALLGVVASLVARRLTDESVRPVSHQPDTDAIDWRADYRRLERDYNRIALDLAPMRADTARAERRLRAERPDLFPATR